MALQQRIVFTKKTKIAALGKIRWMLSIGYKDEAL